MNRSEEILRGDTAWRYMERKPEEKKGIRTGRALVPAVVCLAILLAGLTVFPPLGLEEARGALGTLAGWSFMIDPGHGGSETGAVGPTGLQEKNVNLSVALKLQALLVEEGATVYMTRTDDSYVSITDRWTAANQLGVNRFISIHHNAVAASGTNYTLTLISNAAGSETEDLATKAENELLWEMGLPAASPPVWRVDYCGVLNHTNMPAILTEASFISNPDEEARLRDSFYNQREAEAIHRAIVHHCGGPHVWLIEPREGELLYENTSIKVSVPEPTSVSRVNFYIDGSYIGSETSSPFTRVLETSSMADGVYDLRADVEYGDGQVLSTSTSIAVSNAARKWYFAEGTTRKGFDEWLTMLNPNGVASSVEVTYCFTGQAPLTKKYNLPLMSRMTINVRSEVGDDRDVSMQINASTPIVAERPIYFDYHQKWQGGHVVAGVNQPASEWYFAEGYTGAGFEEWLCIYNPNDTDISVDIEYQGEGGVGNQAITAAIAANSRYSQLVNQVVGADRNVSIKLTSSAPVVAERPIYFDYSGRWQGGSAAMGATSTSTSWYFAEGYTGEGFEEWLCMQNPADTAVTVWITYITSAGVPIDREVTIDARSRRTVFVNQDAGADLQVSISLNSSAPIVAERPMYYDYHGWAAGGDVGTGVNKPSSAWFFTEGYTGEGFEEWLCILNPQPEDIDLTVLYYLPDEEVTREQYTMPALSRFSFMVNQLVYTQGDVSVYVMASQPVVAERPLYFHYSGKWAGGSADAGYFPGMR